MWALTALSGKRVPIPTTEEQSDGSALVAPVNPPGGFRNYCRAPALTNSVRIPGDGKQGPVGGSTVLPKWETEKRPSCLRDSKHHCPPTADISLP